MQCKDCPLWTRFPSRSKKGPLLVQGSCSNPRFRDPYKMALVTVEDTRCNRRSQSFSTQEFYEALKPPKLARHVRSRGKQKGEKK